MELTEKSQSRFASRSEAQYSSKKDSRRENEKANAEGGILAETRRGGTLEDGNEVVFLAFNSVTISGSSALRKKYLTILWIWFPESDLFNVLLSVH